LIVIFAPAAARVSLLMPAPEPPVARRRPQVRRWYSHLAREWIVESRRPLLPAFARPQPAIWNDNTLTAAWLGHSTVLINFFGINIITDPVLFPRCGIRLPGITIGPKRLTAPALTTRELPPIDLVLLSHAHFDHFDMRTLHRLPRRADVIRRRAPPISCGGRGSGSKRELRWGEATELKRAAGTLKVRAFRSAALGRAPPA
jgi:hypothetical protein